MGRPLQQPHPVPLYLLGAEVINKLILLGMRREEGTDCIILSHHAGGRVDDRNRGPGKGDVVGEVVEWNSAQEHGHASILVRPAPFTRPPR